MVSHVSRGSPRRHPGRGPGGAGARGPRSASGAPRRGRGCICTEVPRRQARSSSSAGFAHLHAVRRPSSSCRDRARGCRLDPTFAAAGGRCDHWPARMADVLEVELPAGVQHHARWVRISHWILTVSLLTLAFTGFVILMAHPRLYWGEAGNDLTPALLELPISRNYQHGGWDTPTPFFQDAAGPISADRTYDIFNQNGWGRSLHFLAAWWLVLPGRGVPAGRHLRRSLPLAHLAPSRGNSRRARSGATSSTTCASGFRPPAAVRSYGAPAEMRVLVRGLRGGAADGDDRPDDVAGGNGGSSVPVAPVRRLPVRAHDSFLHVRRPRCCSCSCTS